MSNWEAGDIKRMTQLLVGDYYGERPEEKLELIRAEKQRRAEYLRNKLGCTEKSVVLEIGSGMGLTSKHVARSVGRLHCCDVSASFIEAAKAECADVPNIDFVHLDKQPAVLPFADEDFDAIFADAVFIHLNLYDIYWYFSEFQRVAKRGARVFINIMNGSRIGTEKLQDMAKHYRNNPSSLKQLLCWNSTDAVLSVAAHFGFEPDSRTRLNALLRRGGESIDLLFAKR